MDHITKVLHMTTDTEPSKLSNFQCRRAVSDLI